MVCSHKANKPCFMLSGIPIPAPLVILSPVTCCRINHIIVINLYKDYRLSKLLPVDCFWKRRKCITINFKCFGSFNYKRKCTKIIEKVGKREKYLTGFTTKLKANWFRENQSNPRLNRNNRIFILDVITQKEKLNIIFNQFTSRSLKRILYCIYTVPKNSGVFEI